MDNLLFKSSPLELTLFIAHTTTTMTSPLPQSFLTEVSGHRSNFDFVRYASAFLTSTKMRAFRFYPQSELMFLRRDKRWHTLSSTRLPKKSKNSRSKKGEGRAA